MRRRRRRRRLPLSLPAALVLSNQETEAALATVAKMTAQVGLVRVAFLEACSEALLEGQLTCWR